MSRTLIASLVATLLLALGCTQGPGPLGDPPSPPSEPPVAVQEPELHSAVRHEDETYEEASLRYRKRLAQPLQDAPAVTRATVEASQVAVSQADLSRVPTWSDADIEAHFTATRDERFQTMSSMPDFPRRLTWLYPDDGCYSRAEVVTTRAAQAGRVRPYKLFSFGNLRVATSNASSGYVTWWYHVVPLVKRASTGECVVFDAAIDPARPLPWKDWLLKQVASLGSVKVTVADSYAYVPSSPVSGGSSQYSTALSTQKSTFLSKEWSRQQSLGRDPYKVLGDAPPWSTTPSDTTAPTVELTAPQGGATVSGSVSLTASAGDNVGVTRVEFYAGSQLLGSDSTSPFSVVWDSTSAGNGNLSLTARAFDAAGNAKTSAAVTVTVANSTPTSDEVEPNDSSAQAQLLQASGVTVMGTHGTSADVDWYVLTLGAGKTLTAVLTPNATSDYELYVYNSNLSLIGSSTNGIGQADRVTVTNTGSAAYRRYLKVVKASDFTGPAGGSYTLKATF